MNKMYKVLEDEIKDMEEQDETKDMEEQDGKERGYKEKESSCEENYFGVDSSLDPDRIEQIKEKWLTEQNLIKDKITTVDQRDWNLDDEFRVGGLDISFIVGDNVNACACYVILNRKYEKIYESTKMVQLTAPYIPGFLAFREAKFLCDLVLEQRDLKPEVTPSVLMMDGNGTLHPNRAGISSHIGVLLSMPSIGVAKNLHMLPELGDIDRKQIAASLKHKGDTFDLVTESGELLGRALKTAEKGSNPVFVSVGTGISLDSAEKLVLAYSQYRIPEPTRQADIISREFLRVNHPTARQLQPRKKAKEKRMFEKDNMLENTS